MRYIMYGYTLLVPMNPRVLNEHSLAHWYQKCVTVHHMPKSMSCHMCLCVYMCVCLCMSTERNTYYTYFNKSKNVLKLTYFWRQK